MKRQYTKKNKGGNGGKKGKKGTLFRRTMSALSNKMRGVGSASPSSSTKRKRLGTLLIQKNLVVKAVESVAASKK
jgi:hypothetical protein